MFTDGAVWAKMLELKVFRPEDVVNALNPPRGFRKWVKQKVHSLIASQTRNGLLRRLVEEPAVFATWLATEDDIKAVMKPCHVCGKLFIPSRSDHRYCSRECHLRVKQERIRRIRKSKGVGSVKRRWTQEELARLQEFMYRKARQGEYEELAKKFGRTRKAVESRVQVLRRLTHATRNDT